jgi:hypothetical protein
MNPWEQSAHRPVLSNTRIAENSIAGTRIGVLAAVDLDAEDQLFYSIVSDPDGKFQMPEMNSN